MITVYHLPRTRSQRIVWLMEELGEEYRIEPASFPASGDFLKISPLGLIPTIVDGDIVMFESIAIMQYITGRRLVAGDEAAKALTVGPLPDPAAYAEHLQFLHFGESDLAVPVGAIFRTRMFAKEQANATIGDQLGQIAKRLNFLGDHLNDGRDWVTGAGFTIADISIGYALGLAGGMNLEVQWPDSVFAYWQRLHSRPAYQRMLTK
jgi:glutathione S-transferase